MALVRLRLLEVLRRDSESILLRLPPPGAFDEWRESPDSDLPLPLSTAGAGFGQARVLEEALLPRGGPERCDEEDAGAGAEAGWGEVWTACVSVRGRVSGATDSSLALLLVTVAPWLLLLWVVWAAWGAWAVSRKASRDDGAF